MVMVIVVIIIIHFPLTSIENFDVNELSRFFCVWEGKEVSFLVSGRSSHSITYSKARTYSVSALQRFPDVPDQSRICILPVTPGNPLLWTFLMENLNLGIAEMSVIPENSVLPNTSV